MKTLLCGIGTAVPEYSGTQDDALAFMSRVAEAAHPPDEARALLAFMRRLYPQSGIGRRHTVVADYVQADPAAFEFYPKNWALDPPPSTAVRMAVYEPESLALAEAAGRRALEAGGFAPGDVTHLVLSTCTGFFAPGPDVLLAGRIGLRADVRRLIIGFMGCHAAFHCLRAADHIVRAEPDAVVLHISVELCTIHFQTRGERDVHVSNCLFADGCSAAVYAGAERGADSGRAPAPARIAATHSAIHPGSLDQMGWRIGDTGFEMRLDLAVPKSLRAAAPDFVAGLLRRAGVARGDVRGWAIHPGGKKILEALEEALGLTQDQTRAAWDVLRDYGNMSSATPLFVIERELARADREPGPIVALGFGPGLTMEGAALIAD